MPEKYHSRASMKILKVFSVHINSFKDILKALQPANFRIPKKELRSCYIDGPGKMFDDLKILSWLLRAEDFCLGFDYRLLNLL